jgi:four helix bundle protein
MLQVTELSIQAIEAIRPLIPRIKGRDRSLADQLVRAATSVALNIGEADLSDPGNQRARFYSAAGSANEALVALRAAVAWGYFESDATRAVSIDTVRSRAPPRVHQRSARGPQSNAQRIPPRKGMPEQQPPEPRRPQRLRPRRLIKLAQLNQLRRRRRDDPNPKRGCAREQERRQHPKERSPQQIASIQHTQLRHPRTPRTKPQQHEQNAPSDE